MFWHQEPQQLPALLLFHHMLATPVTCMEAYLSASPAATDSTAALLENFRRIQNILTTITDTHNLTPEYFEIKNTIELLPRFFGPAEKQISITYDAQETQNSQLYLPKILFEEVLICLLSNALAAYTADQQASAHLHLQRSPTHLRLIVRDFGTGMSPFRQFMVRYGYSSTKHRHPAVGLRFVENTLKVQFHGSMRIRSQVGYGTEVWCELPITK